ncbi:hypothetical protein F2P45_13915 [Massilia sp. CCM 8733]|uniref:Uncharacterized protein n=1 Tax=Massilia mucilaginosa TaxID=2609282 RepID=A0ABX0NTL4_9BURK|nr:hypothetical protein [Massilia mucilaginosa]NHZ90103.1 hypothetical protein [Massilia mucilaginosa]
MAAIANIAFCVELLLKCRDAKVAVSKHKRGGPLEPAKIGSKVWGHDLHDIFYELHRDVQATLKTLPRTPVWATAEVLDSTFFPG